MRRIRTFCAMVFLASLFLIFFYSSLHLEMTNGHGTASEGTLKQLTLQVHDADVKTQVPEQEVFSKPPPEVFNVSVSDSLKELIPLTGAYWNRLLAMTLRSQMEGENALGPAAPWSSCRETSGDILQTNMHDFASYPGLFQTFVQGLNCRTPPVLIDQPHKCTSIDGSRRVFLLFAIKSTPENFQRRQAVRETWGKEREYGSGLRVRTVFLLGSSSLDDPDLAPLLSTEEKLYGDLLQWDFHESFLNLTLKMSMFLQWSLKNCPQVSFVFSGDDDVFVNTLALLKYLQDLDATKASLLYAGHVINSASPLRDPRSKYYIPPTFYDGPYPAYAGGGGFVFSGVLLRPLHLVSDILPFFPIDDVYVGMCFKALGVSTEAHSGFQTFDVNDKDRENMCVHKELILVHQRSPTRIKRLWRGIHSTFLTC